ncbi:hypothetical protein [Myceligenerans pegani]|uniref:Uncharacterized protein n=1 Tax=Myceligenerans pegani TaxID=2776917 RepID=A0ABR9N6J6_9MICO|nr:hypothetical protein [Myceligenerans sp. TRM 65318]MBE1878906.1 hypothetical protein [Myceligenerans sp. TRM 65318]MBE3021177.1 hypothetical protein [Myceligenerans sp. TRM 65318]
MTDDAGAAGAGTPDDAGAGAGTNPVVRVKQSAQTRIGATRVGVMIAGPRAGVPTARLLVRSDDGRRAQVDVEVGGHVDLFGEGELELVGVEGGRTPKEQSAVTVRHIPPA